ncbi:hypothetical protein [Deinococcus yavapaiensis]|uniref:Uncharacterized protein n=1 Tax=Deinococcus yavapaiensis KR-236 TaxID=694435 RepID=A0A318S4I4_9DEIO|nr:hypothetical protein [Deinococcus yavapaiensis]PYE53493.1 hypothetical protein DES52_10822 [Deinococcus yavapaiensis KR-236]
MRWRFLLMLVCAVLGVGLAPLALAAFAHVNPSASDALRVLSVAEGLLARRVGASGIDAYFRGLMYLGLSCALIWTAAYVKPRS